MIKYIGSKRVLLPALLDLVRGLDGVHTVLDLFSGTSRVGHALKQAGYMVHANDHNAYAHALATCYVQADRAEWIGATQDLISTLGTVPPRRGYVTETFCERARYFRPENGARIDAIRERIAELALPPVLEAIALVSLMEAADRVDSTTGVQMAYLKDWAPRAHNRLELRVPALLEGPGSASCEDALVAAGRIEADLAYVDPPYNQHSYLGNYHVWESLVRWDKPEVYGVACKRVDCRTRKSAFNSRRRIAEQLRTLVGTLRARYLLVSFSDEGYVDKDTMVEILSARGHVRVHAIEHERYVGAKIGIYNPDGERVGKVSHTRNTEYLFLVETER